MTATAERGQQRGVSRVLAKLDASIEAGHYYEAHQMYRTLYFRYMAQRKFEECLDLLYNGALKLISKQQDTSAADLGLLLVKTLEERGAPPSDCDVELWIGRLSTIIGGISATTAERETLISRSIKWSGDISGNSHGHPLMHNKIAQIFWAEHNTEQARYHYLLCRDGHLCGRILIKIHLSKGFAHELDLFVVQAVLQQLCLKQRRTAEETFTEYTLHHPQIQRKDVPFKQPLLNFVSFLFRSIDLGRLDAFRALCDLYRPSLMRDPSFEKYLVDIGIHFFNAAPPAAAGMGGGLMGGMLGNMFSRLFHGYDDEDDDTEEGNTGQQSIRHGHRVGGGELD